MGKLQVRAPYDAARKQLSAQCENSPTVAKAGKERAPLFLGFCLLCFEVPNSCCGYIRLPLEQS